MNEAQVKETPQAQNVVTSENLLDFQLGKLGMTQEAPKEEVKPAEAKQDEKQEEKPVEQQTQKETGETPPDGTMEGGKVVFRGKWVDKKDVGYRMHLKTEAAKAATARADAAEARLKELEAKQNKEEKPKTSEKPTPDQFTDIDKYAEALEKYGREQALIEHEKKQKEDQAKAQQEKVMAAWNKQLETARKEIEDFDEVLNDSSVSTNDFGAEIQAAIVESEVGANLLYYFAQNPDVVNKLKGMTLTAALREVGKIEVKLEKKEEKKEEKPAPKVVQKSNAPAPIKPVGTSSKGSTSDGYFDENGEFTGTIAEFKQLRKEGKIK